MSLSERHHKMLHSFFITAAETHPEMSPLICLLIYEILCPECTEADGCSTKDALKERTKDIKDIVERVDSIISLLSKTDRRETLHAKAKIIIQ